MAIDYEKTWQGDWNDTTKYGPACRHRRRIVAQLVQKVPHASILDLGCGDGSLLAELSKKVDAEMEGSDVSAEALRIAGANVPRARFFQLDLADELPPKRYDVVVLSEVLEHIADDEAVMRKIAPMARYVVISVPGGPADKVDRRFGHFRNYDGDLLRRKLEANHFEVVLFRRWGWPLYEWQQAMMNRADDTSAENVAGGHYGPLKRVLASLVYCLYFLNLLPVGSQVFAVGKSKIFPPAA